MTIELPLDLGITAAERSAWGLVPPAHLELHTHPRSGQLLLVVCACGRGRDHRPDERVRHCSGAEKSPID